MKTGRLIRIGLLFALTIFVLFWGLNFLKGRNFLQPEKVFYAKYERIGSLMVSSPILYKGFKIGDVREISLGQEIESPILVKFAVTYRDFNIPTGTQAKIISTDLMGTKGVELILTTDTAFYAYGDTISGAIEGDLKDQVNTQMLPLKRKAEDLMSSMDSVLVALQLVFDQENRSNLAQSFEIVAQTLKNVEQSSVFLNDYIKSEAGQFSLIIGNLDSLSANLVTRTVELQQSIANIGEFTDSLNQIPLRTAVEQFNTVITDFGSTIRQVNAGEGSLGKLVMDDSLYYTLESVGASLNELLDDIKMNPKRYVRVSAIDWGRTIIASDNDELLDALSRDLDLEYFVCVRQSISPLSKQDELFSNFKKVETIQVGKQFFYCILRTQKFDKARRQVKKLLSNYPEAAVFSWIEGRWQKIAF